MEAHSELVRVFQEQADIERESVARLTESEKKVGTGAAKLLLTEIRMDSQKHAAVLESLLEIVQSPSSSKGLWERSFDVFVDPIIVRRELEQHQRLRESMLAHIQDGMKKTNDETIRTLLAHLAEDERKHHKILDTIMKKIDRLIR
jgi:rubrerythrin